MNLIFCLFLPNWYLFNITGSFLIYSLVFLKKKILTDMNDPPTDINVPGIDGQLAFKENSGEGVIISEITLTDQDGDSTPICTLVDNAGGRVKLHAVKILVVGAIDTDYESSDDKELRIKLNCSDGHNASVSKSFNIKIIDVNEPITDIKVSNLTVPENQANAIVGIVTVIDPDIGQSHVCTVCDVTQGASCPVSQYFEVNPAMELKTKTALNFEARHIHNININCSDVVSLPQKSLSEIKSFSISVKGKCHAGKDGHQYIVKVVVKMSDAIWWPQTSPQASVSFGLPVPLAGSLGRR
jgi:hypothetical protein